MRRNKQGREWSKFRTLFKQIGMCVASRYCCERAVPGGILCERHSQLHRDRDARYRANKVKARGWKWARVPLEGEPR
jgi:hypothetical protein